MWNQINSIQKATIAVMVIILGWTMFVLLDWYFTYDHAHTPITTKDAVEAQAAVAFFKRSGDGDAYGECFSAKVRDRGKTFSASDYFTMGEEVMEYINDAQEDCGAEIHSIRITFPTITKEAP